MPGDRKQGGTAGKKAVILICPWACGICSAVCRDDAIDLQGDRVRIDPGRCSKCLVCVRLCPAGILEESTFDGF